MGVYSLDEPLFHFLFRYFCFAEMLITCSWYIWFAFCIPLARRADLAPFDFITTDSKLQVAEPGDLLILSV